MTTMTMTRGPMTRGLSLAKAETLLLLRNRTALFNSLALPLIMVLAFQSFGAFDNTPDAGATTIASLAVMSLCFVTYYNLVTTYVARRQDLVLKRLRTGQVGDMGILASVAAPSVVVSVLQIAVGTATLVALGVSVSTTNPILPVAALALGTVAFVVLAAASTAYTKTAETAQITTMPMIMVSTALSGMFFPLSILPDAIETIARLLPASAVIELFNLGLAGIDHSGDPVTFGASLVEALVPTAVLVAWSIIGIALCSRRFRWEPRA